MKHETNKKQIKEIKIQRTNETKRKKNYVGLSSQLNNHNL